MKKNSVMLLIALLLTACAAPAAPIVQTDARMETARPVETVTLTAAPVESQTVEVEVPTEAPAAASFAETVIAAWEANGCLADMARYSDMDLLDLYGIDTAVCQSAAGYADAVGYTTEAVVVEADEATAKEIEALLQAHLEAMANQFRSYDPDALKLVEAAVLFRNGGRVVMIVSPNAETMRALAE